MNIWLVLTARIGSEHTENNNQGQMANSGSTRNDTYVCVHRLKSDITNLTIKYTKSKNII